MAGAVVQVKQASNAGSGTTLASGSLVSNVTSGNFLYIVANAGDNQTITISQNSGTATLSAITSRGSVQEAGVLDKLEHFTCSVTGTGSLDILVTYGASTDRLGVMVAEVSGVSAFDVAEAETDTGSNPTRDVTVTVTAQPAFGLSFGTLYQGGVPTAGAGWTSNTACWTGVSDALLQTKAISATGSLTATFGNASVDRNNACMVVFTEPAPPVVTAQPEQQTASVGATATFTVTATGVTTYQWQTAPDGETWSNVGTNSNSYTTGTLASGDNGKHVRCQLTNAAGTTNTATVRLFIRGLAITGKGSRLDSAWLMRSRRRGGNAFNLLRKQIQPGDINAAEQTIFKDWFWSTGLVAYTLTAESGSYTLSGTAATLKRGLKLDAAAGSYALTGTAATLRTGRTVAAASGSYALTGAAAELRVTHYLSAGAGSFTLTGGSATLARQITLTAAGGTFALSGADAGLIRTARLDAQAGALALTGGAAGLRATRTLAADAGTLALTGSAATLARGILLGAGSGSYTLSGSAAGLAVGRRLGADVGAFTLAGQAAGLRVARALGAGSGTLVLTGGDATLIYGAGNAYTLSADSGTFSLAGTAAGLRAGRVVGAESGALTLSGLAAGLRLRRRLDASAGGFALAGAAVDLRRDYRLAASAAALSITGGSVTLNYSGDAPPSQGRWVSIPDARGVGVQDGRAVTVAGGREPGVSGGRMVPISRTSRVP